MILLRKLKGKKVNKLLIRLRRKGCIFYPIYEIVLVKNNNRAKSSSIEKLGYFNPHKLDRLLFINTSRLGYWLNKGVFVHIKVKKILIKFIGNLKC